MQMMRDDERVGVKALYESCLKLQRKQRRERRRIREMWRYDEDARSECRTRLAGLDEAGRGPLAGPIVGAAVVLAEPVDGLNDSKQVEPEERDRLFDLLYEGAHADAPEKRHSIAVCIIEPADIDARGIQQANYSCLMDAAGRLSPPAGYFLVDGFSLPCCPTPHRRVVKGDCTSMSIAAASIIAKVTRDRIMVQLDEQYPEYGFARHKGYATSEHLAAINAHGPCPVHRKTFAPMRAGGETGFFAEFDELFEEIG
jgi:ribonuclease HII